MSMTVGLSCGHGLRLIDVNDDPPEHDPWSLYPLIVEHPIEIGDQMTCPIDDRVQTVTGMYDATIPIDRNGKLKLP